MRAGLVSTTHAKYALGTSDYATAKAKVAREINLVEREIAELRRKAKEANSKFARSCKSEVPRRTLSSLSKAEQRDLVLKWFV